MAITKAFFLIDWIVDYINTPKMEVSAGQEILCYTALSIIFLAIVGIVCVAWGMINWIKNRR